MFGPELSVGERKDSDEYEQRTDAGRAYPKGQWVRQVGDSYHKSHVAVPHLPGVVSFPATVEEVGEV